MKKHDPKHDPRGQETRKPYRKPELKADREVKINVLGGTGCVPDETGCGPQYT